MRIKRGIIPETSVNYLIAKAKARGFLALSKTVTLPDEVASKQLDIQMSEECGDSGGGISSTVKGRGYLWGVIFEANSYCKAKNLNERLMMGLDATFASVLPYHDFFCYYTGVCPSGFNNYADKEYYKHPERIIYVTGDSGIKSEQKKKVDQQIGPVKLMTPSTLKR
ncbi:unnamed protein product [Toxocara canis]|uniref:Peptidase S1 domain-containing protein n=1 Tax=Toxocara canis TaxID=6265 RepID=A0A183VF99_TOXCA|nr:unnamed protein product [Toxocara canis]